jgi:hypothetical protein
MITSTLPTKMVAARTPWRLWLSICFAGEPRKVNKLIFRGAVFFIFIRMALHSVRALGHGGALLHARRVLCATVVRAGASADGLGPLIFGARPQLRDDISLARAIAAWNASRTSCSLARALHMCQLFKVCGSLRGDQFAVCARLHTHELELRLEAIASASAAPTAPPR